ncbi:peroxisomal N(1)-acetyl-spermine/spermidine oxidase-like [Daktulosphaira vitifoliae]|uniref:peroxisomal N(1)-acetyl-spermine/spermidine oxidase-like n=1 Tax=Daktulosphaira vitifoliae TaxID=58002 RepID=UPI0021A9EF78|nr:peroxisomal N(1)-acetyl-spermine/spermidine oxidase-like [Daktulosphaira vitifoliae]
MYRSLNLCKLLVSQNVGKRFMKNNKNPVGPKKLNIDQKYIEKVLNPTVENTSKCNLDLYMLPKDVPEPKVVIIGGGIAGLSAAQRLAHCGFTKFSLYEAGDMAGGRIKTCYVGDTVAELGSEVINGGSVINQTFVLAAMEGLLDEPAQTYNNIYCWHLTSEGRTVDKIISYEALSRFDEIKKQAYDLAKNCSDLEENISLYDYMHKHISATIKDYPQAYQADCARIMGTMLNELRNEVGANLKLVSARNYGQRPIIPPEIDQRVPSGHVKVLASVLRDIPPGCITYCKPVERIIWGDTTADSRASVLLCDGQIVDADYVIVALPLGVLKCNIDNLFVPKLPERKVKAIASIGYGHRDRYFLEYTDPFWMPTEGEMLLSWSPDELAHNDHISGWVTRIGRFRELPGSANVLEFDIAGTEAAYLETATDADISSHITSAFRRFLGDPTISEPCHIVRSTWSLDPYFCGAYSFYGLSTTSRDFLVLSKPEPNEMRQAIPPVLFFAGEATDPIHYGTTHGARASGIREAERIISITSRIRGSPPK